MSWRDKSKNCSQEDFDEFRKELLAVQHTKERGEAALIRRVNFEEKWVGYCATCARVIPSTKETCPSCNVGRF